MTRDRHRETVVLILICWTADKVISLWHSYPLRLILTDAYLFLKDERGKNAFAYYASLLIVSLHF